jgi:hypothetical protein
MHWLTNRAVLLVAAGVTLGACASNRYRVADDQPRTTLSVRNDNYLEHNIYLLSGSQRIRLGVARSNTTTRLIIPPQYVFGATAMQFLADPIGSRATPVSDRITVSPGDEVQLTIPPHNNFSSPVLFIQSVRPPDR